MLCFLSDFNGMTKRKNKKQKDPSETPEEDLKDIICQGKACSHVPKGVNFNRVKRVLKTANLSVCSACTESIPDDEDASEVWLCLQCCYCGCGRMSTNQHSLQHFKTIHSDCHSLVLSRSSGIVWCYDCDDEVPLQTSQNLKQCVEFIMRLKLTSKPIVNKEEKPIPNNKSLVNNVTNVEIGKNFVNSETIPTKMDSKRDSANKKIIASSKIPVKGLRNLGNTCYFNAVMQSLSQTSLLFQLLEEICSNEYKWEVPSLKLEGETVVENIDAESVKITLPREFQLVNTFLQFLQKMSSYSQSNNEVINPNDLFSELQKKSPQFQYFHQQDSHELLRQFLDGLKQDEMKRQKRAILRHFNIINLSPEDIEDDTKKLIKAYSCYASHTIVEKVFGGLLISTVLCEECKVSSQVFEPFMDLSLPLFEEKMQENSDHSSALLDGGKQGSIKAVRIRQLEQECEENNEYMLSSKSKKDFDKPSKHQEKKMKQLEKKEKKKNKKMQNKKSPLQIEDNSSAVENSVEIESKMENVAQEEETENKGIEKLNTASSIEQNGDHPQNDHPTKCDETECKAFAELKTNCPEQNGETLTTDNQKESDLSLDLEIHSIVNNSHNVNNGMVDSVALTEDAETVNKMTDSVALGKASEPDNEIRDSVALTKESETANDMRDSVLLTEAETADETEDVECVNELRDSVTLTENADCVNGIRDSLVIVEDAETVDETKNSVALTKNTESVKEIRDSVALAKDAKTVKSDNKNIVILFDEIVSLKEVAFLNGKNELLEEEKVKTESVKNFPEENKLAEPPETDSPCLSVEQKNRSVDSSELNDRLHALSLQVKEVRIRKDSDKQDSILSSSPQSEEESKSLDPNTKCYGSKGKKDVSWSQNLSESQTKEWILKSLATLKCRKQMSSFECSLDTCLSHFTKPEILMGNNKFRCENCSEKKRLKTGDKKAAAYNKASKQLLIFSPPAVLTLHLKRFQQVGMSLRKVNRFVEFPLILDIASYCSSACLILPHMKSVQDEILYSLYGIVEHSGHLRSGHYTAYVKAKKRTVNRNFTSQLPLAQWDLEQLLHKFSNQTYFENSSGNFDSSEEEVRWYYISDNFVKEVSEAQVLRCQAYLLFYERIK